jgi:hypothetical protein
MALPEGASACKARVVPSIDASPAPSATSTEIVHRPDPGSGIQRGKWEAPAWAFYAMAAFVVVLAAAYLVRRLQAKR